MKLPAIGLVLFAVSATGALTNLWARDAFPTQWGGPNIGAGMLQMLFYAGAITGTVLIVLGLRERRRDRRS
jgi:hypothetical protein